MRSGRASKQEIETGRWETNQTKSQAQGLRAGKERWPLHSMEAELTIEKFLVEKSKLGLSAAK
jgi:hypothetical protein